MKRDLQGLVDGLHARVGLPVTIEDVHLRLLAYSPTLKATDALHAATILNRRVPAETEPWLRSFRLQTKREAIRVPANPSIGSVERLCMPAWCEGRLYGFVWLIGTEALTPQTDEAAVLSTARLAAEVLHRERVEQATDRGKERELVRDLLSQHVQVRTQAAAELVEANIVVAARAGAVIVLRPRAPIEIPMRSATRSTIDAALEAARHMTAPARSLHLVHADHAVFIILTENRQFQPGTMEVLADRILSAVRAQLGGPSPAADSVLLGVGDTQPTLERLVISYDQALKAAHASELLASLRPIATWATLGIYRLLLQFPTDERTSTLLHPGLLSLIAQDRGGILMETLESYLDLAGDAQRTRRRLCLHRATLYYRLHRIERMIGIDLRNGDDRLAMHLSIKLARLAGLLPALQVEVASASDEHRPTDHASLAAVEQSIPRRVSNNSH